MLAIAGAIIGTLRSQDTLAVTSLSILIWVFGLWCVFQIRTSLLWAQISCKRTVNGRDVEHKPTLWAEREAEFEINISFRRGSMPPLTVVRDWLPDMLELTSGNTSSTTEIPKKSVTLSYRCRVCSAGLAQFPGLHFKFGDPYGFFLQERFFEQPLTLRCLPSYDTRSAMQPTIKRLNNLPQHGIHRLQRAGLGSELLELREYQTGDPPKSIAWKASARRDRLMTRQYESEVPVRVTVIIDGWGTARLGSYGYRNVDRTNHIAASVGSAAVAAGDAIGVILVDEQRIVATRPAYGDRALHQMLRSLSDFSIQPRRFAAPLTNNQLLRIWNVCRARFPDLLDRRFHPVAFTWLPISPWKRRRWQQRMQLSGIFGELFNLSAKRTCDLFYDDAEFLRYAHAALVANGRTLLVSPHNGMPQPQDGWATRIGNALNTAVLRARDNEVFVVLTDLESQEAELAALLEYAKVAIGRHHRVLFISPTHGSPPQPQAVAKPTGRHAKTRDPEAEVEFEILSRVAGMKALETQRRIRRQVGRIGAVAAFARPEAAASLVMAQAELAGSARSIAGAVK